MNVNIISQFTSGRSGAKVYLAEKNGIVGVYKTDIKDPHGVAELSKKLPFRTPEIYDISDDAIFMEYINGVSIKEIIKQNESSSLNVISDFILNYIEYAFSSSEGLFDFGDVINEKINKVSSYISPNYFSNMHTIYPKSVIHGDFTFDNMIYYENEIVLIDLSPTPLSSIHFDMNKFRQDLSGYWFVRYEDDNIQWVNYCEEIYRLINDRYPSLFDDKLYNLMISRIFPYCKENTYDFEYIKQIIVPVLNY